VPGRAVFTGCATGATSLAMAANSIKLGEHDITIAVGLDKHERGAFAAHPSVSGLPDWYGEAGLFLTTHFFGMKINRYMHDFGITPATLAKVSAKAMRNGAANPSAWRRKALSEEEILNSQILNYPLTQYMYCGPDEGAAAVVLCRADKAHLYTDTPVYLRASTLRSRREGAFELLSPSLPLDTVPSPTVDASREAYEIAGIGPSDVDVIQLQDTDAGSEIIHMAENGFCADGDQEKLIAAGETEITGRLPINTDGGLLANGEPVGASGLRQIFELVNQLRGRAGDRQISNAKVGYAQLYGAPGTAAVTILST
jgi:acetyl-CoA acetyltransferase